MIRSAVRLRSVALSLNSASRLIRLRSVALSLNSASRLIRLRSVALFMQFYVYAIYSPSTDKVYVGQTKNMVQRLHDHRHGYSPYTSRAKDWVLFHKEILPDRSAALKREKQLKSFRGREFLRNKLGGKND